MNRLKSRKVLVAVLVVLVVVALWVNIASGLTSERMLLINLATFPVAGWILKGLLRGRRDQEIECNVCWGKRYLGAEPCSACNPEYLTFGDLPGDRQREDLP